MHCKNFLRVVMREKRRALKDPWCQKASYCIFKRIQKYPPFMSAQTVALYAPHEQEPDLLSFMRGLHTVRILLPRITPEKTLHFFEIDPKDSLINNRYGILEPSARNQEPVLKISLMIVPVVAFDVHGYRLGRGQGFYDRTVHSMKHPSMICIGVAYEFQKTTHIPKDPWDQRLDAVVTEKRTYVFPDEQNALGASNICLEMIDSHPF